MFSNGPTDMYVSPEIVGQIRAFAFNPLNTKAGVLVGDSGGYADSSVPLPESMREEIFRNAGMQNIYGVNIVKMIEFGTNKKYNSLFDTFAGASTYAELDGTNNGVFADATEEIMVAVDNTRGAFIRPVARGAGDMTENTGNTFQVLPDDQFNLSRVDKAGFWGHLEEGRVCLDSRAISGIII